MLMNTEWRTPSTFSLLCQQQKTKSLRPAKLVQMQNPVYCYVAKQMKARLRHTAGRPKIRVEVSLEDAADGGVGPSAAASFAQHLEDDGDRRKPRCENPPCYGCRRCSSLFLCHLFFFAVLPTSMFFLLDGVVNHSGRLPVFRRDLLKHPSNDAETHKESMLKSSSTTAACRRMGNVEDIRNCFPERLNSLMERRRRKGCGSIQTWNDVQRCLTGRLGSFNTSISQVHVLGERNSGTKFVTNELQKCFRRTEHFKVHRDFVRGKHWFQPIDEIDNNSTDFGHSLIVVVVRDPVEWMASMLQSPYHSPSHVADFDEENEDKVIPLPWQDFVQRPWTTTRTESDARIIHDPYIQQNTTICREGFLPHQVVPCQSEPTEWMEHWKIPQRRWRGFEPIYEQRPRDGTPYDHLLQLRSDKIVNWILQLPMLLQIGGLVVVRYDDLLQHGTEFLLQQVADVLAIPKGDLSEKAALPAGCKPTSPQPPRIGHREVPHDFRLWIDEHVNVETERLVGYR